MVRHERPFLCHGAIDMCTQAQIVGLHIDDCLRLQEVPVIHQKSTHNQTEDPE